MGWHWGFAAAGIGMLLGLAIYVAGTPLDGVAVKQWLNERLGKNQRVLDVIQIDQLPRSEIGKVLKRALRDRYLAAQA